MKLSNAGVLPVTCLLVPLCCAMLAWWLGQDISWDVQNYHLYNPYSLLHSRQQLDLMPAGTQSLFSPILDLFFYMLVQVFPPAVVGMILGALHGFNFILLLLIARQVLPHSESVCALAWLIALCGLLSVGFRAELGTAMHDNLVSLFMLGSVLQVLKACPLQFTKAGLRRIFSAGLLAGLACAGKLTMGSYALGLCFALLANALWFKPEKFWHALVPPLMFGIGVLLAFVLLMGPLYYQNWQAYGNPIFPLYNAVFGSNLADAVMIKDERFITHSVLEFVLRPVMMSINPYLVSELAYRQYTGIAVLLIVFVWLGAFMFRKHLPQARQRFTQAQALLLLFMLFSYGLWQLLFSYYRYLITWELLVPLALLLLLVNVCGRPAGTLISLVYLTMLTAINFYGAPDWGRSKWTDRYYQVQHPGDIEEVSTMLLMGTPLAWLVPALDIQRPFLQIDPNFPVGQSRYGREILRRLDTSGQIRVIFDAQVYQHDQVDMKLRQGGYVLDYAGCSVLAGAMASQSFQYQYCPVISP